MTRPPLAPAPAPAAGSSPSTARRSVERLGTHRVVAAETTWQRLRPLLADAGITRVADLTGLDDIGVPVWQAVRPNSRNLSVSQGKGFTHALARVSAAMESYESYAAEQERPDAITASTAGLTGELTYDPYALGSAPGHRPRPDAPVRWCPAEDLIDGRRTWLPTAAVTVDLRVHRTWIPPTGSGSSSNGLAGGNTLTEATLHALLEVVERSDLARVHVSGSLWSGALPVRPGRAGAAAAVLRRCAGAGAVVEVVDCTGPWGVPTFAARLWSAGVPAWFSGSGTHPDADVALSRAVTEAVQSRLTAIAGARDDLPPIRCPVDRPVARSGPASDGPDSDALLGRHRDAPADDHPAARDLHADLAGLVRSAERHGLRVLRTDLTPPGSPFAVVRVVVPGASFDHTAWS
ncbi:YcaO-like family protein [Streptomyces sp. NPDC001568]|uniref:YcaO-like family protein n=1 Tax=Streptomyces sp. NPDC001568 TaxID=3364588 RepID=UPI0036D180A0